MVTYIDLYKVKYLNGKKNILLLISFKKISYLLKIQFNLFSYIYLLFLIKISSKITYIIILYYLLFIMGIHKLNYFEYMILI